MGRAAAAEDELERRDGDEDAAGALPVSMERRPPARRLLGAGSARLASAPPSCRASVRASVRPSAPTAPRFVVPGPAAPPLPATINRPDAGATETRRAPGLERPPPRRAR